MSSMKSSSVDTTTTDNDLISIASFSSVTFHSSEGLPFLSKQPVLSNSTTNSGNGFAASLVIDSKSHAIASSIKPTVDKPRSPYQHVSQQLSIPTVITMLADKPARDLGRDYQPCEFDIHYGRGKHGYTNAGNVRLRSIAAKYANQYKFAKSRFEKTLILDNIIEEVQSLSNDGSSISVRFLQYDSNTNCWREMSTDHARLKVGKAVRDVVSSRHNEKNKK